MLTSTRGPTGCNPRATDPQPTAAPRQPGLVVRGLRRVVALGVRQVLRSYNRLTIVGRENLPADGPFVLVANHSSHLDVLCLLAAVPLRELGRTYPTASADYFFASTARAVVASVLFNGVPFHRPGRGDDRGVRASLEHCRQLLTSDDAAPGGIVILFPEGSRSTDGAVRPFKRGVGVLVAGTDVLVVPCHIDGTFEAMPKGRRLPRPRRIVLTIGRPRAYAHAGTGKAAAQAIADDLHDAVAALGGAPSRCAADESDADEAEIHLAA